MPYFSPAHAGEPFVTIARRLSDDLAAAEPRLRAITETQASEPPVAGKWSPKQNLGHLIDSAANNHHRFVRAQGGAPLQDPGYAQEHWVASQHYAARPWAELVDLWVAYNRHLAHVIAHVPESKADVPVHIGDDPVVSLRHVALDYVGHIQHHLRQIFEPK